MINQKQQHWDNAYQRGETEKMGWYESTPEQSLALIEKCGLSSTDVILDVGTGSSTLIDHLLEKGYTNLLGTDISAQALNNLQTRLGEENAAKVQWIVDDLTNPQNLMDCAPVDLWHDRAVLHFFCDDAEKETYLSIVHKLVKPGGYVILAAFALEGAEMCSGLSVNRYDDEMQAEFLGTDFEILESFSHIYYQPSGNPRPFVYSLFKRKA